MCVYVFMYVCMHAHVFSKIPSQNWSVQEPFSSAATLGVLTLGGLSCHTNLIYNKTKQSEISKILQSL
jgi:hypothetical protein